MSDGYKPILWNKFKKQYDAILWVTIMLYLLIFIAYNQVTFPSSNFNTVLIRAFGTLAIVLLHVILLIGPAARLSPKFLPILYNRRHLGVSLFIIGAVHGLLSLFWFHGNGNVNMLVSLFTSNTHYNSLLYFPFQTLGFFALLILAVMAFTSHDFWLSFLSPKFWKAMHMLVYVAYALIIMHVALGIIQFEKSAVLIILLFVGLLSICLLHCITAFKENKIDAVKPLMLNKDWQYVCTINDIEDSRAKMAVINKERIAVFKYDGKLSAVHNVCKHQMGPLGEGKVVDGCITCPWHGYQYKPEDGCAPAPFKEKLHTYPLQLIGQKIYVNINPLPQGTYIEPLVIPTQNDNKKATPFFIGWSDSNSKLVFALPKFIAVILSVFALAAAFIFAAQQKHLSSFKIDYDNVKKLEGWLTNKPVPMLTIIDGKDANGNPTFKNILLVDAFKKGANETIQKVLKGEPNKYVKLSGYLSHKIINCGGSSGDSFHNCASLCTQCITGTTQFPLMEIQNGSYSFAEKQATLPFPNIQSSTTIDTTISGEIIDPKCYFGAMNPGQGKAHLSCATRCISGGIMPLLKYTTNGVEHYAILLGSNGEVINKQILNYVGVPSLYKVKKTTFGNWEIAYFNFNK